MLQARVENTNKTEEEVVTQFRNYLRVRTEHPKPDNAAAVSFLIQLGTTAGLECAQLEVAPGRPVAILTWKGASEQLPSILLSNHYDVVPAVLKEEQWKYSPWEGVKEENGDIYGRGTQDMKSVGIQYIEALRRLKKEGYQPKRTIHVLCVPDEEIGGAMGMNLFIHTDTFKKMNVGVVLDEGLASPSEEYTLFYAERATWWVTVTSSGPAGHGSRFIENTAVEKLMRVIDVMMKYREEQFNLYQRDEHGCGRKLGDVITLSLTALNAGIEGGNYNMNVIPTKAKAGFDVRIPPTEDLPSFFNLMKSWAAAEGCECELVSGGMQNGVTDITPESIYYSILKKSFSTLGITVNAEIFPAGTDSRYFRHLGIPAFGFSPMNNTPILLHDHNEFLNEKVFLRGIEIYQELITQLSSQV